MEGLNVVVDGQNVELPEQAAVGEALKKALSGKKFKSVLAGKVKLGEEKRSWIFPPKFPIRLSKSNPCSRIHRKAWPFSVIPRPM